MNLMYKRITKLISEKASLVIILGKKSTIFLMEAPQTGFDVARGLENVTPRGYNYNKNKK